MAGGRAYPPRFMTARDGCRVYQVKKKREFLYYQVMSFGKHAGRFSFTMLFAHIKLRRVRRRTGAGADSATATPLAGRIGTSMRIGDFLTVCTDLLADVPNPSSFGKVLRKRHLIQSYPLVLLQCEAA